MTANTKVTQAGRPRRRRMQGEGSVYRRASDGLWVGKLDLGRDETGKRRRRVVYGRTQAEALKKLTEAKAAHARGVTATSSPTLEAWLDTWLDTIMADRPNTKPNTLKGYRTNTRAHLVPILGRVKLDKLEPRHVRELQAALFARGLSAATVKLIQATLSSALGDAVTEGLVARNVASSKVVPSPTLRDAANSRTRRALTNAEALKVLAAAEGSRLFSRWITGLALGLRQGELLGLTWDAVDLQAGTMDVSWQLQRLTWRHGCAAKASDPTCGHKGPQHCPQRSLVFPRGFEHRVLEGARVLHRPKSTKLGSGQRTVALVPVVHMALMDRHATYLREREGYTQDHGLVWPNLDGSPMDPEDDRATWAKLLASAGVEHADQHAGRHTAISLAAELGMTVDVRMAVFGHQSLDVAKGYTHVSADAARTALTGLGDALTPGLAQGS